MKWICPYRGTDYVFDDERLTASEARLQKRVTDGMTPFAAERARFELDPDAWIGALLIAARRQGVDLGEVDADEFELMAASTATKEASGKASAEAADSTDATQG